MSARTQVQQSGDLQVGRRQDPAEARVSRRLEEPDVETLHGNALSEVPELAERTSFDPPSEIDTMLLEAGSPLPSELRGQMEGAFGESFGDVRLHTGQAAAGAARALNSAAFATGTHVGVADHAYRPETPAGRGLIAHELAHVSEARAGRDAPGMVRGVGFFQAIGDFFVNVFAGNSFDDGELMEFIDELTSGMGEYTQLSDNKARYIVERGLHDRSRHTPDIQNTILARAADLEIRWKLIEHMLNGPTLNDDEDAILTILRDADQLEREQLVNKVTRDKLIENFQGAQRDELRTLIYGSTDAQGNRQPGTFDTQNAPQSVQWELDYTVEQDSRLASPVAGLAVRSFEIEPDGQSQTSVAEDNFSLSGLQGTGEALGDAPVSHPKNVGGLGRMEIWVVPQDASERAFYAEKTAFALPAPQVQSSEDGDQLSAGVRYGNIPAAEDQTVKARVDVDLGAEEIGSATVGRTMSVTDTNSASVGDTSATTVGSGVTNSTESESSMSATARRLDRLSAAVGLSAQSTRRFEVRRDWEIGVSRIQQDMLQFDAELSGGTETVDETEGEVNINAEIGGEAALAMKQELGIDLGVDLDFSDLLGGGLLDEVLSRIPDKRVQALAAILRIVQGASGNLKLNVSPEGSIGINGTLGGGIRARRLWRESKRRDYSFGSSAGRTTTNQTDANQSGGATVGGDNSVGANAQLGREAEDEASLTRSRGTRNRTAIDSRVETLNQRVVQLERQLQVASAAEQSTTTKLFVPKIDAARLSFHIVKDGLGRTRPQNVPRPRARSGEEG